MGRSKKERRASVPPPSVAIEGTDIPQDSEPFLIPAAPATSSLEAQRQDRQPVKVSSHYVAIPLVVPSATKSFAQYIYASSRASWAPAADTTEADNRTVFLANLPADTTEATLRASVANALRCEEVELDVRLRQGKGKERARNGAASGLLDVWEREGAARTGARPKEDAPIPALFATPRGSTMASRAPSAHVRLPSSAHLHKFVSLPSFSLVSTEPPPWSTRYKAFYDLCRPGKEALKDHVDGWMAAWEAKSNSIVPLATSTRLHSKTEAADEARDAGNEEGEWTVVKRGGHHGRSSILPTQPQGHDPYAQRYMAERDATAGAKVMKRGFAEAFAKEQSALAGAEVDGEDKAEGNGKKLKRRGGELVTGFYKYEHQDRRKSRSIELRKKFEEDKARIERMRQQRKFRPY